MMARIMIVEDNALNIKLFCDLLDAHGHETRGVTDSRGAMATAHEFAPDLVITDIQLPHIDGMELMRRLRADPELCRVPIMAVTAYAGEGDDERIREAGAQAYVSKPISVARFAAAVDALLEEGPLPAPDEDAEGTDDAAPPQARENGAASDPVPPATGKAGA